MILLSFCLVLHLNFLFVSVVHIYMQNLENALNKDLVYKH